MIYFRDWHRMSLAWREKLVEWMGRIEKATREDDDLHTHFETLDVAIEDAWGDVVNAITGDPDAKLTPDDEVLLGLIDTYCARMTEAKLEVALCAALAAYVDGK